MTLRDLHWLVMLAIESGPQLIAEVKPAPGKEAGAVAALLWGQVSPEINAKLGVAGDMPLKLQPVEWTSGKIRRIVATIGRIEAIDGIKVEFQKVTAKFTG